MMSLTSVQALPDGVRVHALRSRDRSRSSKACKLWRIEMRRPVLIKHVKVSFGASLVVCRSMYKLIVTAIVDS